MKVSSGADKVRLDILIVMPSAKPRGGAELSFLHLLRGDRRSDAERAIAWHVVFLESGPLVGVVRKLGVRAVVVDAGRVRNPFRMFAAVRAIRKLVRSTGAVAVLGWMTKSHLYGGPAAWWAGVPAIWFQKGLPSPKSVMEQVAARIPAAGILTCSSYVAGAQQVLTPSVPIRPVHSAVELEDFNADRLGPPDQAREQLDLPRNGPLIGIFGRLQHWKGMHVAIDAMPAILKRHPDAKLLVAGGTWPLEPAYAKGLLAQVDQLGLNEHVIFAGELETAVVPLWMQACDVIVHASDREPFGIVLLEAMALGKPLVAGSEGGPVEIVTEGVNGLFAPYGDSAALASVVLRYLDDPEFARQLGQRAAVRAQEFSSKYFAKNVTDAVLNILGIQPPGGRIAVGLPITQATVDT